MRRTFGAHALPAGLVFALALIAPACSPAQALPTAINPCGLLTVEDVSAALGQAVEPGRPIDDGLTEEGAYSTTCIWVIRLPDGAALDPTKPMGGRSFVILNVMNWPRGSGAAQKFLDDFQLAFEAHEIIAKPVPVDVGADRSIWWGDGVAARKADVSFGVSVAHAGGRADRQEGAESLARTIVKRLESTPA